MASPGSPPTPAETAARRRVFETIMRPQSMHEGLHHRTPLCNFCGLEENGNRQLCASCYSDDEHELTGDYDNEASDYESGESSWESFAYTSNEEADEEFWSDEDMLD